MKDIMKIIRSLNIVNLIKIYLCLRPVLYGNLFAYFRGCVSVSKSLIYKLTFEEDVMLLSGKTKHYIGCIFWQTLYLPWLQKRHPWLI